MPRFRYFAAALVLLSALLATFTPPTAAAPQDLFAPVAVNGNPVHYFNTETGFVFTTAASPAPIVALGRLRTAGSSGTRTARIYRVVGTLYGTGTKSDDDLEDSVTINLNAVADGEFAWANLSTPFQPLGNTQYIVVSDEGAAPSDTEAETIDYTLTPGFASSIAAVYASDSTSWDGGVSPAGNVYGGVNLRFGTPAPVASAVVPATAWVGEIVHVDARASVYSRLPQDDGSWSIRVEYGDEYPDGLGGVYRPDAWIAESGHAYQYAGTFTVKVQAKNSVGVMAQATYQIVVSDIPEGTVQALTEQGSANANGVKLQELLEDARDNIAAGGGHQTIVIPDGMVLSGGTEPILLPYRSDSTDRWITVKWANADATIPAHVRAPKARPAQMPRFVNKVQNDSSLSFCIATHPWGASGGAYAHHYRFVGVAFEKENPALYYRGFVNLGYDLVSSRSQMSHDFIFDRVHMDGGPVQSNGTGGLRFGFLVNADNFALSNSSINRVHAVPDAVGLQSINFVRGSSVWNNFIEASGEGVIYGGGGVHIKHTGTPSNFSPAQAPTQVTLDNVQHLEVGDPIAFRVNGLNDRRAIPRVQSITGSGPYTVKFDKALAVTPDITTGAAWWGPTPKNIETRRTHIYKDPAWQGSWFDGSVKNHWESKFSKNMVVDSSIFENNWHGDQVGFSLVLTVETQDEYDQPWCNISNVQVSNVIFRKVGGYINTKAGDTTYSPAQTDPPREAREQSAHASDSRKFWFDNLLGYDSGYGNITGATGHSLQFTGARRHQGYFLNHSTLVAGANQALNFDSAVDGIDGFRLFNSVLSYGSYGFKSPVAPTHNGVEVLNTHMSDYLVRKLLMPSAYGYNYPDPLLNFYPDETIEQQFVNMAGDNYELAAGSAGKGRALDGGDVGVRISLLRSRLGSPSGIFAPGITAVETGVWPGAGPADLFTGVTPNRYVAYFNTRTGFQFDTAANPGPVVALGRLKGAGNTGTRTMQIVRKGAAYDGSQDEVVASITVNLDAVAVGEFAWGTLPAPFQPLGGTTYLCVSDESGAGAETEAELMSTYTLTPGFATNISARYEYTGGGTRWAYGPGADNNAYGGVNLRFGGP